MIDDALREFVAACDDEGRARLDVQVCEAVCSSLEEDIRALKAKLGTASGKLAMRLEALGRARKVTTHARKRVKEALG